MFINILKFFASVLFTLAAILVVLKMLHVINISWVWVLSPLWFMFIGQCVLAFLILIIGKKLLKELRNK